MILRVPCDPEEFVTNMLSTSAVKMAERVHCWESATYSRRVVRLSINTTSFTASKDHVEVIAEETEFDDGDFVDFLIVPENS